MRVSIDHAEVRKGFLFKTTYHVVTLVVHFSFEEKQIIKQRNLTDVKLMDRRPANAKVDARDEKFELRVKHLVNAVPDQFLCATPSAAKIYEEELLRMMGQLKLWLSDNAETGTRTVVEF